MAARRSARWMFALVALMSAGSPAIADEAPAKGQVPVKDGIVQPRQPVPDAVAQAMAFLKKADGAYVPGKLDGELAGYFTSAFVLEDGSRAPRQQAFPGRQHAYFINTFLLYHNYSGEKEWVQRARDLADWNIARSTAPDWVYGNLPWSVWTNGKPGGSQDKDSLEPDKAAFIATAYLNLFDVVKDEKYVQAAKAIAETLARTQAEDGSWPFRVIPQDGKVFQQTGGAPVFYVEFFQRIRQHEDKPEYRKAYDRALKQMIQRNVEENRWGTYHEDIREKPETHLSAEPMSFTANWLLRNGKENPKFIEMGRKIIQRLEEKLVHTEGHPAAPAPAVSEQSSFQHMMPGHTARYCAALVQLHRATGDERAKRRALSGINATTYMQTDLGLFRTYFQLVNETRPGHVRPNWYSQHLYTVCHVLESLPHLPELKSQAK